MSPLLCRPQQQFVWGNGRIGGRAGSMGYTIEAILNNCNQKELDLSADEECQLETPAAVHGSGTLLTGARACL